MTGSQGEMRGALELAPTASRIVLVLAAILLARIGSRYIVDPVGAMAADGITLHSVRAMAVARVGLGAFPLAIAIFALGSVFASRALMAATSLIATVMVTALVVRVVDIAFDGGLDANRAPLAGESVFLILSVVALVWNSANRWTFGRAERD